MYRVGDNLSIGSTTSLSKLYVNGDVMASKYEFPGLAKLRFGPQNSNFLPLTGLIFESVRIGDTGLRIVQMAQGYQTFVLHHNGRWRLPRYGVGNLSITGGNGTVSVSSDACLKEEITPLTCSATDLIMKLRPVTYELKDEPGKAYISRLGAPAAVTTTNTRQWVVMAEQVQPEQLVVDM